MKEDFLYDISYVCKLLNTTSRTLRFYEEKGLIKSTLINGSTRRQYTNNQILHIKNILILRSLGLSIKAIAELQTEKYDLKDAVLSKRAEIYASINSHIKQINLLNEALYLLNSDESIFEHDWKTNSYTEEEIEADQKKALIGGHLKTYTYKEAWANWWNKLTDKNKAIIQQIPNFDKEIFKDITGIEV